MGKDLSGGDDPGTGTPFRVHRINSGKGQSHSRCKYKKVKNMMLLEPDGLYIHSAWWAKGEFTPENLSHWRFVRRRIIPSRFRLMGEGRFYSREFISQKFCKGMIIPCRFSVMGEGSFYSREFISLKFVKGMIIPSRFRLMGERGYYSREIVSQTFL